MEKMSKSNSFCKKKSSNVRKENKNFLIGEDRMWGGNELYVDLIPSTSWFSNVRSCIKSTDWNKLRKLIYQRINYRCETCHKHCPPKSGKSLEAHERWHYTSNGYQVLKRLVGLCKMCHLTTHIGFAETIGLGSAVKSHLQKIRNFTTAETQEHISRATRIWEERSKRKKWKLDLSILERSGYCIQYPKGHGYSKISSFSNKKKLTSNGRSNKEIKKEPTELTEFKTHNYVKFPAEKDDKITKTRRLLRWMELRIVTPKYKEILDTHRWWMKKEEKEDGTLVQTTRVPDFARAKDRRLHVAGWIGSGKYHFGYGKITCLVLCINTEDKIGKEWSSIVISWN
jgi:Pyruvate/2-oxoacid:ferredoxin oxidoreductase delta subunit